jgi:hypothetical protein
MNDTSKRKKKKEIRGFLGDRAAKLIEEDKGRDEKES